MVLRLRESKMASEQPVKKKLRRGEGAEDTDETDFIQVVENGVTDLAALHLSLPPNINEDDITLNTVNRVNSEKQFRTSDKVCQSEEVNNGNVSVNKLQGNLPATSSCTPTYISNSPNISIQPAPDISNSTAGHTSICSLDLQTSSTESHKITDVQSSNIKSTISQSLCSSSVEDHLPENVDNDTEVSSQFSLEDLDIFQTSLVRQCLCGVTDLELQKSLQIDNPDNISTKVALAEWPTGKILQFLSNLQFLFDVYLKQNNKGAICSRIVTICENISSNECNLIEEIIALSEVRNKYINYLTPKVLSSFLIISKTNINNEWLESIVNFLVMENIDYIKMNFALEIIKRVVEWKDIEVHVLEDSQSQDIASSSSQDVNINVNCITVQFSDPESYDTSAVKGLMIKSLESKWPELISKIHYLISNNNSVQTQTCILTFFALWESTISVKANLSVIDTKPFYANLEKFVVILHHSLSPLIWKQLLSLFNEVLCYGSTLALQDMLPNDICQLAHLLVRYVKDFRLLDNLPYRRNEGLTVNSFVGTIASSNPNQSNVDKTLLQKMVLLILKSVAITVKETRSDSSDSSVGSDDYDYFQDMQVIERSIRDVLKKLETFIKSSLDFHPETPFSIVLVHLFSDQDDYMIEAMVCTLDITVGISYRHSVYPDLLAMLNPVHSFIEFLKIVRHHSDVLLDFLVSNETCFLLYLLRLLKYVKKNWDKFLTSCCEGISRTNELDSTMTVLIRLKMQISRLVARDLFPYNINPVLRLLEICENMYEGNEYS